MKQFDKESVGFLKAEGLLKSRLVFDGEILQLYVHDMKLPQGLVVERELIHHHPGVGILAITQENKVVLVKQYRPAVDQFVIEIPAGMLDKGDAQQAILGAKRELEEETAYQGSHWQELTRFYVSPGFLNEEIILYAATQLEKVENPLPQDEDEAIELLELTVEEAEKLLKNGEIKDAKTIIALQYWLGGLLNE